MKVLAPLLRASSTQAQGVDVVAHDIPRQMTVKLVEMVMDSTPASSANVALQALGEYSKETIGRLRQTIQVGHRQGRAVLLFNYREGGVDYCYPGVSGLGFD